MKVQNLVVNQESRPVKSNPVALPLFRKEATFKVWRNKLFLRKIFSAVSKDEQSITVLLQSTTDNKKVEKILSTLSAHDSHHGNDLDLLLEELVHSRMKSLGMLIIFI